MTPLSSPQMIRCGLVTTSGAIVVSLALATGILSIKAVVHIVSDWKQTPCHYENQRIRALAGNILAAVGALITAAAFSYLVFPLAKALFVGTLSISPQWLAARNIVSLTTLVSAIVAGIGGLWVAPQEAPTAINEFLELLS